MAADWKIDEGLRLLDEDKPLAEDCAMLARRIAPQQHLLFEIRHLRVREPPTKAGVIAQVISIDEQRSPFSAHGTGTSVPDALDGLMTSLSSSRSVRTPNAWAYRTTSKKASRDETLTLAVDDKFLCRSAFNKGGAYVARVRDVKFGDIMHVYYAGKGGAAEPLGSFEIMDVADPRERKGFAATVKCTALHVVSDEALHARLAKLADDDDDDAGYVPDPLVGKFTGWRVEKLTQKPQPFPEPLFPHGFVGSIRLLP